MENFTFSNTLAPSNISAQPQVLAANVLVPFSSSTWLLDSGESHHVTTDLNNLVLHTPYNGNEELIIGDGTGLHISHVGSLTLSHFSSHLQLNNVLYVPSMSRNIISISQFCVDNNATIEFLPNSFRVKDLKTGASLFQGLARSGVYEI